VAETSVAAALADACIAEGCDSLFGLMGDANMFWISLMAERPGVRVVHARHEDAAVAMADGYARSTGRVGLCSVTCGPGLTQVVTSLTAATRRRTPLVLVAGDIPRNAGYHLQAFDPQPLVATTGAAFARVDSAEGLATAVQHAFYVARDRRTPVVLSVPQDLFHEPYPWDWPYVPSTSLAVAGQRVAPDPRVVAQVVDELTRAERPVVLAGRGAMAADARSAVIRLAERLDALLATTLLAKGWFDDEPFHIGVVGAFSTRVARELLAEADCVVAVGARLGHYTSEGGYIFPNARVIRIDIDPHGLSEGAPAADLHVVSDAGAGIDAILEHLERPTTPRFRTSEVADRLRAVRVPDAPYELSPGTLDPRAVARDLDRAIPNDWMVVIGAGHFWNFLVPAFSGRPPTSYLYSGLEFGAIGQGIGNAIGVAVGMPDRRVVLIEGDGSLLMHVQELEVAARHHVSNLCVVVMNDGAYGSEVHKLERMGVAPGHAVFGAVDLAAVGRALGIDGSTVDADHPDLGGPLDRFASRGGPAIVDVRVSPTVVSDQYRRLLFGIDT
jgi:thiamine pyrophosphate-dependent acetolactate synthase large subunit-like protein